MKIALAQTRPVKGDLLTNIGAHVYYTHKAAEHGASIIFFSELSLTGYEPKLAHVLATTQENPHFEIFQAEANRYSITICAGVPIKDKEGIWIGMVIFGPNAARQTYGKKYIHPDEEAYFIPGPTITPLLIEGIKVAPAICYELSCPEHVENAILKGAGVYVASSAKTVEGNTRAFKVLANTAQTYQIPTMQVNCVGFADGSLKAGASSVWNKEGSLLMQLGDDDEGLLIYDMASEEVAVVLL